MGAMMAEAPVLYQPYGTGKLFHGERRGKEGRRAGGGAIKFPLHLCMLPRYLTNIMLV